MIHSIINEFDIFNYEYEKKIPTLECKRVDKCIMYGVKCKEGFRVAQIFSTNPDDFLSFDVGHTIHTN